MHHWWYDHVKAYLRPLTIWNRRLEVMNMTIDFAAIDFALVIPTTSATSRTFFLRFAHDSNIVRSQVGETGASCYNFHSKSLFHKNMPARYFSWT